MSDEVGGGGFIFLNLFLFKVSWPLLGIPLTAHTVAALVAICAAVVIYAQVLNFPLTICLIKNSCSQNPVVNPIPKRPSEVAGNVENQEILRDC